MKEIIKKILILIIIISSVLLTFSFSIKEIIINSISTMFSNNIVLNEFNKIIEEEFSFLDNYNLNKIKEKINNSSEIDKITEIYLDNIIIDILNETNSNPNIEENINIIIDSSIPSEYSSYINIINNKVSEINFEKIYTNTLGYVKVHMNASLNSIINVYNILINKITRVILIMVILLNIVLIILLNKKVSESLKDFSKVLNIIAIIQIILSLLIKASMVYLDLKYIIIISVSELIVAFILSIIFSKKYNNYERTL